jgi:4-hydroxy-tetrahydrodipicolinate reductase
METNMLNIIVTGAAGRMGRSNIKVISEDKNCKLTGAIEVEGSPFIGKDSGEIAGIGKNYIIISSGESIDNCDVIMDFTAPSTVKKHVDIALRHNIALVIGSTGVNEGDMALIKDAGKKIPVIWAPNFSVGINLIAKLTRLAAETLNEGFDAEIVEVHHRMKKDSPSGTAVKLLNVLKEVYKTGDVVYGREGLVGERPDKQIGVFAIRGGDVVGDHTVSFFGIGERVEITHKASSRETLSRGALRAAKYIVKKGAGFYTMEDVLGL